MEEKDLNQVKKEVQKILDKHLEEDQRFSIQDFDEESVFLIIDLLLEKDDLEREHIRAKIQKNIKESQMEIRLDYEKILEIKNKLDFQKNEISDLNDLKELVNVENEVDEKLKNI
jgi:hypothetical protein